MNVLLGTAYLEANIGRFGSSKRSPQIARRRSEALFGGSEDCIILFRKLLIQVQEVWGRGVSYDACLSDVHVLWVRIPVQGR